MDSSKIPLATRSRFCGNGPPAAAAEVVAIATIPDAISSGHRLCSSVVGVSPSTPVHPLPDCPPRSSLDSRPSAERRQQCLMHDPSTRLRFVCIARLIIRIRLPAVCPELIGPSTLLVRPPALPSPALEQDRLPQIQSPDPFVPDPAAEPAPSVRPLPPPLAALLHQPLSASSSASICPPRSVSPAASTLAVSVFIGTDNRENPSGLRSARNETHEDTY
ncbi:hypothetical protein ACLOJK_032202 [Asimina triloba]